MTSTGSTASGSRRAASPISSRDHLDYHPSVEAYLEAKLRLFSSLVADGGSAVIDVDHEHSDAVVAAAKQRGLKLITVGRRGDGIRLLDVAIDGFTQAVTVEHAGKRHQFRLPLVGAFQVENALVAAGLAIATGGAADRVFAALASLKGAKGRLDLVGEKDGAPVFVDYAHKPDALEKAIEALRPYVKRHLVVVFGAGGDRDKGKRPLMGEIAARMADRVIVTDDNPRSENPARHSRRDSRRRGARAERARDRRPPRGDPRRRRRAATRRCAADRRQGPRSRPDRRRANAADFSDHEEAEAALRERVA